VAPAFRDAATELGQLLGGHGIHVIYGGGRVGLMGLTADAALAAGGTVTGVIPRFLAEYEVEHPDLTELIVVETMHERKRAMMDRADAFIVLPGGLGTLEEAFEVLTWKQLGLHDRPILLVNVAGYWDRLVALIQQMMETGFIRPEHRGLYQVVDTAPEVLAALAGGKPRDPAASDFI
jgi:uncharacterized protein (TIGR00730 family)